MTRVSRLIGGGIAALLIAPWLGGMGADAATKPAPPSGDNRASSSSGNVTTCADVGLPNDTQFGADNSSGNTSNGFTVTSDGQNLTVSAIPANTVIDVLIVKGGDGYNAYPSTTFTTLPASGLHAPLVGNPPDNVPTISHWFLCYGPTPPQVTAPSASSTGDCDGADLTLNAGTASTIFTVTRSGDVSGTTYSLGAGAIQVVHVSLDSAHSSVNATAGGPPLTTFTRDNAVCDANTGGGGNNNGGGGDNNGGGGGNGDSGGATVTHPAVASSTSCGAGITVLLSNLRSTAAVMFTLTAPDGTVSHVTVDAGQSATRSFAVAEDTTGIVTVAAPGLTTKTVRYHKNCTTVLGVKHVRHHHTRHQRTQGEQAGVGAVKATLPFTGFNSRRTAVYGALLVGLGCALCVVAARRRQPAHARR